MKKVSLYFTANEDNSSVSLVCFDEYETWDFTDSWCKLDYSIDGKTWNTYIDPDSEDQTLHRGRVINLNKGETVYFRAALGNVEGNPNINGFCREQDGLCIYHYFVMEGSIRAGGNIQFLLENTGKKMDVPRYCYYYMFYDCISLTQAPALPATTLADSCYTFMFQGCTSLTKAPALPAMTLADGCYYYMFSECTSLTQAPALPATTMARSCYSCMFLNCTSLTKAPVLPATTLDYYCYSSMFYGCTSLTQAPALPATTLDFYCYNDMFFCCTSLTQAPVLQSTTLASGCYSGMFQRCTSLTQAPVLPATVLADSCYSEMFSECTSLTQAPVLPATTLSGYCYYCMFKNCTNLNSINVNFSDWNTSGATKTWVQSVSSSGTFTCPAELPEEFGDDKIPTGWTVVRK